MQEVGQDGSPLVAEEIKHLPLEGCHLEDGGRGSFIKGKGPGMVSTAENGRIHITRMKKHIQVIKVPHTPQLYIHTHTHTVTGTHIHRSAAVVSMVTAWSSSQSSDCKRGAPPESTPKLMRIYGPDPP